MKICGLCKETKSSSDFYKNRAKKDGLANRCKTCMSSYGKEWYKRNQDSHKESASKRKENNLKGFVEYLSNCFCIDCGTRDIRVLQFDHLPQYEKLHNVSEIARSYGVTSKTFQEEVNKCEVVCANCHMIRTGERAGWLRILNNGA